MPPAVGTLPQGYGRWLFFLQMSAQQQAHYGPDTLPGTEDPKAKMNHGPTFRETAVLSWAGGS